MEWISNELEEIARFVSSRQYRKEVRRNIHPGELGHMVFPVSVQKLRLRVHRNETPLGEVGRIDQQNDPVAGGSRNLVADWDRRIDRRFGSRCRPLANLDILGIHKILLAEGESLSRKQDTAHNGDVVVTSPTDSNSVVVQHHIHPAHTLLHYLPAPNSPDKLSALPGDHNYFRSLPLPRMPSTADPTPRLVAHSDLEGKSLNRSRRCNQDNKVFLQTALEGRIHQLLL